MIVISDILKKYDTDQKRGTWFMYVLLCEGGYYYIGMTLYPSKRITDHFNGNGSNFTKRHIPENVIELYSLGESDRKVCYKMETAKTREYRNQYGKDKVVGGKHLLLKTTLIK